MTTHSPPARIGKYRVLRVAGVGGMGTVYEAQHPALDRRCAVKVLVGAAPETMREGIAGFRVRHPNLAEVYDLDVAEDGAAFLVMEWIEGETLQALLDRETTLPPERALEIARDVAQGLAALHDAGIVHRDVKPANVMLTREGSVKVTDYGIAKLVEAEGSTASGVVGTPAFMAPEQMRAGRIDARTDVYGLGVTLYVMLAGGLPFDAAQGSPVPYAFAVLHGRARELRVAAPHVPEPLARVVHHALEKDPGDRFATMAEFRDALGAPARWTPSTDALRPPSRRRRALLVACLAALVCAIGAGLARVAANNHFIPRDAWRAVEDVPTRDQNPPRVVAVPTSELSLATPTPNAPGSTPPRLPSAATAATPERSADPRTLDAFGNPRVLRPAPH